MTPEASPKYLSPLWLWQNAIPNSVLDVLTTEIDNAITEPGTTVSGLKTNVRNSDVILTNGDHWFSGILANLAFSSNQAAQWKYNVTHCEMFQIAKYSEGQYFDWHNDTNLLSAAPTERKLTVICLLSTPVEDFAGGELEIKHVNMPELTKGSVIVFPSLLEHRVAPILHGVRYSATCWLVGPKFK